MRWIFALFGLLGLVLGWFYFSARPVEVKEVQEVEPGNFSKPAAPFAPKPGRPETSRAQLPSSPPPPAKAEPDNRPLTEKEAVALIKDDQGRPRLVSQADAIRACKAMGMHVPTMREMAEAAQSKGAHGILEVGDVSPAGEGEHPMSYSVDGSEELTYYYVKVKNPDGKEDHFYYNPRGYRPSTHDFGRLLMHSSSVDEQGRAFTFGLNAENGVLGGQQGGRNDEGPQPAYVSCWKDAE